MIFTSDTHFGSERTLKLSRRPYKSVAEMDAAMIEMWNSMVAPDEEVFHLGDFGNYEVVKQLNGRIHLILGNYEANEIAEGIVTVEKLYAAGFVSVDNALYMPNFNSEIPEVKQLKLVHKPTDCDMEDPEVFNLFGHIHGKQMCKRFGLDVGVDAHYMRVITQDDVSFFFTAIKKYYDQDVFE